MVLEYKDLLSLPQTLQHFVCNPGNLIDHVGALSRLYKLESLLFTVNKPTDLNNLACLFHLPLQKLGIRGTDWSASTFQVLKRFTRLKTLCLSGFTSGCDDFPPGIRILFMSFRLLTPEALHSLPKHITKLNVHSCKGVSLADCEEWRRQRPRSCLIFLP